MDRTALVTTLGLAVTAFLAGGAAVGILRLVRQRPAILALVLVAAAVSGALLGTAWKLERHGTPYW